MSIYFTIFDNHICPYILLYFTNNQTLRRAFKSPVKVTGYSSGRHVM